MMCLIENKSAELCLGKCLWKRDVLLNEMVGIGAVVQRLEQVFVRVTVLLGFNRLRLLLRFARAERVQCLIGRNCQKRRTPQFRRNPRGSAAARRQEKIDKTINPLVADSDRRCQHQGGLIHPLYHFETQNCLARSRRCYQMQPSVLQVAVKVTQ